MTYQEMKQPNKEQESGVDKNAIILEHNLHIVEANFFRGKKNITRVMDSQGNRLILKTGGIDKFQPDLFKIAKEIEAKLDFNVPTIVKQGEGWILLEEIQGKFLNEFYNENPDWCVETSYKVAQSYQRVIAEFVKRKSLGNILGEGQDWLFSRLDMWSKPIIDAGLIDFSLVDQLKKEFEDAIRQKGEHFFGLVHGNIIGDHIVIVGDDMYLLDVNAIPRPGKGYYDFLRALDFMCLKMEDEKQMLTSIPKWIKQYLSEFDESELRLLFAFRNIGILGWDILYHEVEYISNDIELKKQLALKFIKREY